MAEQSFVKIAKALADPTRHRIIREVRAAGQMTCSGVCERFRLAQPTISHHITTLAKAGVLKVRTEGQYHVLSVDEKVMRAFAAEIAPAPARTPAKKKTTARSANTRRA